MDGQHITAIIELMLFCAGFLLLPFGCITLFALRQIVKRAYGKKLSDFPPRQRAALIAAAFILMSLLLYAVCRNVIIVCIVLVQLCTFGLFIIDLFLLRQALRRIFHKELSDIPFGPRFIIIGVTMMISGILMTVWGHQIHDQGTKLRESISLSEPQQQPAPNHP